MTGGGVKSQRLLKKIGAWEVGWDLFDRGLSPGVKLWLCWGVGAGVGVGVGANACVRF